MSAVKAERYAANEGYGEDFLGLVPKPWLVSRLKDKATFNPSKSEIKELPKECTFAPMEKLKTDSLLTDVTVIPSNISGSYTYFRENDLLIAKVTPCFENRNVAIAKNLTNGIGFGSSEINVVRVSKKANQRWFFYLFLSSGFIEAGASKMAGAGGLKRIPSIFLETFAFALPPLSEQTAIAAYLDTKTAQIDRQIDLLSQKVTQYGKLKRSLINETVTRGLDKSVPMKDSDVVWIGEIPEHWEVRRFKEIFNKTHSGWTPDTSKRESFEGDNIWVTIRDMDGSRLISTSENNLSDKAIADAGITITPKGSLLFSFKLSIGKIAFAGCDLYTNEAIISIESEPKVDLNYFFHTLPIFLILNAKENIYGAKLLNQGIIFNTSLLYPISLPNSPAQHKVLDTSSLI
jgi:type I restriction enzyme S subunit